MGYYTDYQLDPNAQNIFSRDDICHPDRTYQAIEDFLHGLKGNAPFSHLLDAWNEGAISATWYDHRKDMIELSVAFPDVLFTLWGHGDEPDDLWQEYYLNGKCQVARAEIIYPAFDESQLRSLNSRECPYCYGEGVLHADGYGSIGCPKCNGAGEVFDG